MCSTSPSLVPEHGVAVAIPPAPAQPILGLERFLLGMLRGPVAGIEVPQEKGKLVLPSPIRSQLDRIALVREHLAGRIVPREAVTAAGKCWEEARGRAVAARALDVRGQALLIAWDIDASGAAHQTRQTPEQADALARRILALLEEADVPAVLATSGGGTGRHVILVPEQPLPGAFAHWFASLVAGHAANGGGEVEIRPTSRSGTGGNITLPGRGWAPAPGGGRILGGSLTLVPPKPFAPFLKAWTTAKNAVKRPRAQRAANVPGFGPGEVLPGLEAVATALSRITAQAGQEFSAYCPQHEGQNALKINPDKHVWHCFVCNKGGGGPSASVSLARHLLPGRPENAVVEALLSISHGVHHG